MRGELRTDPAGRAAAEPGLCPSQPVRVKTLAAALGKRGAASAKLSVGAPAGSVCERPRGSAPGARSSTDRATGFYPVGWGFESLRARRGSAL